MSKKRKGTIYLLHFDRPLSHAKHYMGWTKDLIERLARHRSGDGSKLIAAVKKKGDDFTLVFQCKGTRDDERKLKRRKNGPKLCPICQAAQLTRRETA